MTIPLPRSHEEATIERFQRDPHLASEYLATVLKSEVVREGLRILMQQRSIEKLKLAGLRDAIKAGLDSGPAESLDMDAILAEARRR